VPVPMPGRAEELPPLPQQMNDGQSQNKVHDLHNFQHGLAIIEPGEQSKVKPSSQRRVVDRHVDDTCHM
jgi:hypothetical protein